MEPPMDTLKSMIDHVESYVKTMFELYKLKLIDSTITIVTSLVSQLTVLIVMLLFVLVLTIGVALWLGEILGKIYYGFFLVAGLYLLMTIVFHVFLRAWLRKPIGNLIVKEAFQ